ncbi:hypothetical protein D3C77_610890 [compost metagenome]
MAAGFAGVAGTDVISRVAHRWATHSIGTAQDGCGVGKFRSGLSQDSSHSGAKSIVILTLKDWLLARQTAELEPCDNLY